MMCKLEKTVNRIYIIGGLVILGFVISIII